MLGRIKMGDNELEFQQIYTIFQPKINRYLTQMIGHKEAEDLTQDVLLKVSKGLGTSNNQSQLSTWIYKIATNAAIDRMRSRSFKQETTEMFNLSEEDLTEKNVRSNKRQIPIEEQVIRKEMNECIQRYISFLPENYRTVLILSELEGLKDSEIAAILELSIGAVKIRLHRAKERLKKELLENCNFYRTECCGRLACEHKGPITRNLPLVNTIKR